MEISKWIAHWAEWVPSKAAIRFEGAQITYRELEDRIAILAGFLRRTGTTRGDRVAYLGPNCPELVETFFACARLGAIFVPLNARMPAAELQVFIDQSTPRTVVAEESLLATARACAEQATQVVAFSAGAGIGKFGDVAPTAVPADPGSDSSAPVLIAFTSGTTGTPRGAVMSHEAVTANALDMVLALQIGARDEILTYTPMFHFAGLNLLTTPALSVGATVTVHRQFDPGSILEDIDRIPVTLLVSPPPMTGELAAHRGWEQASLTSLRCIVTGGTTVTERSIRCWRDRGVAVVQGYGLTEAGNFSAVPIHDSPDKSLTAGKPTMRCQLRVVDIWGHDVAPGARGEVVVRGPSVMQGYWQNPEATRQAIRDGWFHTGDLGFLDEEGFLHVVDRIKEIIVVGVSNVSPADLEAVLAESPDIEAAAVVARPDEKLGEVPVAFVVAAPGRILSRRQVLSLFEGRIASYKHPRDVIFLESMPRTSVGKPEKKTLRAMAHNRRV